MFSVEHTNSIIIWKRLFKVPTKNYCHPFSLPFWAQEQQWVLILCDFVQNIFFCLKMGVFFHGFWRDSHLILISFGKTFIKIGFSYKRLLSLLLQNNPRFLLLTKNHVNPFIPNTPFLMFSGGRERVHWERMG